MIQGSAVKKRRGPDYIGVYDPNIRCVSFFFITRVRRSSIFYVDIFFHSSQESILLVYYTSYYTPVQLER